jgi:regulator of protease activity HflC (stomatin/prohibitin superfamily)
MEEIITQGGGIVGGVLALIVFLVLIAGLRALIRVCPSNHILVVTGGVETVVEGKKYGFRLQKGGWTFVIPFIQSAQFIDITIIPINVQVDNVNSANGITVGSDATACVCIDDMDKVLLYSAVQQLLGKSRVQIQEQIQQTMIGNFRATLNKTTPLQAIGMVESVEGIDEQELTETTATLSRLPSTEETVEGAGDASDQRPSETPQTIDAEGERAIFRNLLLADCREDLSAFGMNVVSVSLQRIWDTSNYIANLANKTLSRKRQEVEIEEARLQARAERAESDSKRRMLVAENRANEKILQARQDVELFRRQCDAAIHRAKLEADSAIVKAHSAGQRREEEITAELQKLRNSSEVIVEAEAKRRAAEILAGGEAKAVEIVQQTQNGLLQQKVDLLKNTGDTGKIALFITQLPHLFDAYRTHAQSLKVDNLLVLNEQDGFNSAVNRGPAAFVDFLRCFEQGLGISVKELITRKQTKESAITEDATPPTPIKEGGVS